MNKTKIKDDKFKLISKKAFEKVVDKALQEARADERAKCEQEFRDWKVKAQKVSEKIMEDFVSKTWHEEQMKKQSEEFEKEINKLGDGVISFKNKRLGIALKPLVKIEENARKDERQKIIQKIEKKIEEKLKLMYHELNKWNKELKKEAKEEWDKEALKTVVMKVKEALDEFQRFTQQLIKGLKEEIK